MKKKIQSGILKNALLDESINFHCLLDIDNFGEFNSKYSYEKGNKIIEELSVLAKKIMQPKYWLYVGSDEFYFSINEKEISKETSIFQFMQEIENRLNISVSIGIISRDSNECHKATFHRLKNIVQVAKSQGGNKIVLQ